MDTSAGLDRPGFVGCDFVNPPRRPLRRCLTNCALAGRKCYTQRAVKWTLGRAYWTCFLLSLLFRRPRICEMIGVIGQYK